MLWRLVSNISMFRLLWQVFQIHRLLLSSNDYFYTCGLQDLFPGLLLCRKLVPKPDFQVSLWACSVLRPYFSSHLFLQTFRRYLQDPFSECLVSQVYSYCFKQTKRKSLIFHDRQKYFLHNFIMFLSFVKMIVLEIFVLFFNNS